MIKWFYVYVVTVRRNFTSELVADESNGVHFECLSGFSG